MNSGVPKFYNLASGAQFIQTTPIVQKILTGTVSLVDGSYTTVVAIPANSNGQYYLFKKASSGTVNNSSAAGFVISDSTTLFVAREASFDPGITLQNSALNLQAKTTSSSFNGTYTYLVVYFNP